MMRIDAAVVEVKDIHGVIRLTSVVSEKNTEHNVEGRSKNMRLEGKQWNVLEAISKCNCFGSWRIK